MNQEDKDKTAYTGRDKYTIERRVRWLLAFLDQDLKKAPKDDLGFIEGQIMGFSYLAAGELRGQPLRLVHFDEHGSEKRPNLTKRQIQSFQKKLREGVNALMNEDSPAILGPGTAIWKFIGANAWNIRQIRYEGITLVRNPRSGAINMRPNVMFPGAFWLSVATVLSEVGPRLQRCQECGTIFLAKTSRKSPCSSKCSKEGRNRRYMEKKSHEEKYEIRRAVYIRQVQRKQGTQKVKVQKRGPLKRDRKKKGS